MYSLQIIILVIEMKSEMLLHHMIYSLYQIYSYIVNNDTLNNINKTNFSLLIQLSCVKKFFQFYKLINDRLKSTEEVLEK